MGNVLLDYNPQIPLETYCSTEQEKEIINKELFEGPEWVQGDIGLIKDCERYDLVKKRVPEEYWNVLKQCCDNWDICMTPLEGAKSFCEYVKNKGYHIYILSNASDKFYKYFLNFSSLDYFDGIVISSDVKMIKPDSKIYEYLLNKYGLIAEECLFIDDREDNVRGAITVGMHACQFKNDYESIKETFQL